MRKLGLFLAVVCAYGADTYSAAERRHWAFQPRKQVAAKSIDEILKPTGKPADRRSLIRRAYFDLTGLPPTPEELETKDPWPKVVDKLLDSPAYAEQWARHWLDVVRFAESDGYEYDTHRAEAWRYRDYIIKSIRDDKPYDQFLREQLAGDEIDPKNEELLVAASFNRLGPFRKNAGNQDAAYNRNEVLVEMTNVIGSGMLGVTLGCARCHDHKFDPIRQKDYYRIQAFFASTQHKDIPRTTPAEQEAWKQHNAPIEAEVKALRAKQKGATVAERRTLEEQAQAKEAELLPPLPTLQTVEDGERFFPAPVPVSARALGVLLPDGAPELPEDAPKPRLELAKWITDPANPLTARVMVNRIWQHHFGTGIVATPNDFGRMGTRPSNPELLDWLANRFVESGWKMKPIHRLILLSQAYQQEQPRRRLTSEELRDAMLAVSGRLNRQAGGPSVIVPIQAELVKLLYNPAQWRVNDDPKQFDRRSIYLFQKRNMRLPFLEVFDAPDTLLSCARREQSTHAPQALELLNGEFSNSVARSFADRIRRDAGADPNAQIARAFALALGRPPDDRERQAALQYLKDGPLSELALSLFLVNDFLYL
jgi:hypothetical protein